MIVRHSDQRVFAPVNTFSTSLLMSNVTRVVYQSCGTQYGFMIKCFGSFQTFFCLLLHIFCKNGTQARPTSCRWPSLQSLGDKFRVEVKRLGTSRIRRTRSEEASIRLKKETLDFYRRHHRHESRTQEARIRTNDHRSFITIS